MEMRNWSLVTLVLSETVIVFCFQECIVDTVRVTSIMDELWQVSNGAVGTYISFRYIGTSIGVMRMFPGLVLSNDYDPVKRPW